MRKPLEKDVVKSCLEYLRLRGILAWRQNQGAMSGEYKGKRRFFRFASAEGISDILAILPPAGRLLAVECKRPGREPTEVQRAFLEAVRAHGGLALVVTRIEELVLPLETELSRPT